MEPAPQGSRHPVAALSTCRGVLGPRLKTQPQPEPWWRECTGPADTQWCWSLAGLSLPPISLAAVSRGLEALGWGQGRAALRNSLQWPHVPLQSRLEGGHAPSLGTRLLYWTRAPGEGPRQRAGAYFSVLPLWRLKEVLVSLRRAGRGGSQNHRWFQTEPLGHRHHTTTEADSIVY